MNIGDYYILSSNKGIFGLLQDHFHIEAHIGPGQYGPRLRLKPICVSLF
jgi:hypothetical protein